MYTIKHFLCVLFFFVSCLLSPVHSQYNNNFRPINSTGWVYPNDFRTNLLICDPNSIPRAEEVCIRRCSSDNDCRYRPATVIPPSMVTATNNDINAYYQAIDNLMLQDTPSIVTAPDAPYTSIKKKDYLDWSCNATLGYCTPFTDDACNWGWRRIKILRPVSLTFDARSDWTPIKPGSTIMERYVKSTLDTGYSYYKYQLNSGFQYDLGTVYLESYMCNCRPIGQYGNPCGPGTCQFVKPYDESTDNVETGNIQYKTTYTSLGNPVSLRGTVRLYHPWNYIGYIIEKIAVRNIHYSVCICPDGYDGPSCNNVIDNCGTLYCQGRGSCAKEIDPATDSTSLLSILNIPSEGQALLLPIFVYQFQLSSSLYWRSRDQAPIYHAFTSYLDAPAANKLSVRTCACDPGYIPNSDPSSTPFINSDSTSRQIMYPNTGSCNSVDYNYICCNKGKGVWPTPNYPNLLSLPVSYDGLCVPRFAVGKIYDPCQSANCYGFNCDLTCQDLCSNNQAPVSQPCSYPVGFADPKASLHNLCLQCKPGRGPPALSSNWKTTIGNTKVFADIIRHCNLIYSRPPENPNAPEQQCGGYGYSLNLDKVSEILGINRALLQVKRRQAGMEINFDPIVLIESYVNEAANAYINEDNIPTLIKYHPAFQNVIITPQTWYTYAQFYYQENVNVPCTCADGYTTDSFGSCSLNACDEWTTVHPSDASGIAPNGQTCGGLTRSYSGCKITQNSRTCTCREGFAGSACEQVLCAHANGSGCSSNGYCDREFNHCVCKPGYIGEACEIKMESATPCGGNGQQTKSFPTPSYQQDSDYLIPSEINIQTEYI